MAVTGSDVQGRLTEPCNVRFSILPLAISAINLGSGFVLRTAKTSGGRQCSWELSEGFLSQALG